MKPEKLTYTERLTLANQFKILSIIDKDNAEEHKYREDIVTHGYEGFYDELYTGIYDPTPEEVCSETFDILDMYRGIEGAVARLQESDKKTLDLEKIEFKGFDANNDRHYGFMHFLTDRAGRYDEHKGKYINSHTASTLDKYRRMLTVFNTFGNDRHQMTAGHLRRLIDAL
jgi:uncharacterized protein YfbU (UPF0304 family)